jgi:hypothetical protein
MRNFPAYTLAALLIGAGIAILLYKSLVIGLPLTHADIPDEWGIETKVTFSPGRDPVKLTIPIFGDSPRFDVIDQNFIAGRFGLTTEYANGESRAVFSIRRVHGAQTIFYKAILSPRKQPRKADPIPAPDLQTVEFSGVEEAAARSFVKAVKAKSADRVTLAATVLKRLQKQPPVDEAKLLLGDDPSDERVAAIAVRLLGLAEAPARTVHGISVRAEHRSARLLHWIEVHEKGRWKPLALKRPAPGAAIPDYYLPWWRGPRPLVDIQGGEDVAHKITVARVPGLPFRSVLASATPGDRELMEFSLFTLPLGAQQLYRIILLLPVGVLLLVLFRNVVGIRTFGTFMPVLIALTFRETQLAWGVVLYVVVVGTGLAVRLFLERLHLLVVPRLACVLMFVILLMAALSVLTFKLGLDRGVSLALFPIVIITMTIERMSIVWDERGPGQAVLQGAGTLFAAAFCYLIMSFSAIEHVMFVFPETVLILMGVVVLMGRYAGYRLTELWRFRQLAGPDG